MKLQRQSIKLSKQTCNSNRIEEITIGDKTLKDNCWYQNEDGPKLKYCRLVNVIKICVNKSLCTFSVAVCSPSPSVSIISAEICFFKVQLKRVSSK